MKLRTLDILAFAAVLTGAASCGIDSRNGYDLNEIVFNVAVNSSTRATVEGNELGSGDVLGVWVHSTNTGSVLLDGARAINSSGRTFRTEEPFLWPSSSQKLDFRLCYPYGRGSYDPTGGIVFTGYSIHEDFEPLYCDKLDAISYEPSLGSINVAMERALARVSFTVQSTLAERYTVTVKSIKVHGVRTSGNFSSLPEPAWTSAAGSEEDVEFTPGEERVMIPQTGEFTISMVCDIVSSPEEILDREMTLTDTFTWTPGRTRAYVLVIQSTREMTIRSDTYNDNE